MDIIKKIFKILSSLPAFTSLFKKAASTGKIDPNDAINALSSISKDTNKVANTAIGIANAGGSIPDVARELTNIGEVEVLGQKINTKTLIPDLKRVGGVCGILANILEKMPNQSPQEVVNFGNAASDVRNWQEFVK